MTKLRIDFTFSHVFYPLTIILLCVLKTVFLVLPKMLGTREAGFVHAISSAGVAYAVTRACSAGKLRNKCGCDTKYRGDSNKGFEWAGCSDDIKSGIKFSEDFVDAREQGRDVGDKGRVLMNLHNNEAGRQVSSVDCLLTVFHFMDKLPLTCTKNTITLKVIWQ